MTPFKKTSMTAVAAALLAMALPSGAAVTVYTSQAAFSAATSLAGVDTFDNLGLGLYDLSYTRSVGGYSYNARVVDQTGAADTFATIGTPGDTWLSTDTGLDTMIFSGFAPSLKGIGANFFGSNSDGAFLTGQPLLVTLVDSLGTTSSQTVVGSATTSFLGFVTTGNVVSMSVTLGSAASLSAFPAMNNLTLAAAVPEPGTYGLMALGLGGVLVFARRRRND